MQVPGATFVPAEGLSGMNPRAAVEFRQGFSEPIRLTPAQFVALEYKEFVALWKVGLKRYMKSCMISMSQMMRM